MSSRLTSTLIPVGEGERGGEGEWTISRSVGQPVGRSSCREPAQPSPISSPSPPADNVDQEWLEAQRRVKKLPDEELPVYSYQELTVSHPVTMQRKGDATVRRHHCAHNR